MNYSKKSIRTGSKKISCNLDGVPEHSVVPIYLNNKNTKYLEELVLEIANQLPGLPLKSQIELTAQAMRSILTDIDVMGCAFERLAKGETSAVYTEGIPLFKGTTSTGLYRIMALILGSGVPFQYQQQHNGELIATLEPAVNSVANSNTTGAHFGCHTDDAYIEYMYRVLFIALLGQLNESGAETGYAPIEKIVAKLSERQVVALMKPSFIFRKPASLNDGVESNEWSEPQPILFELPSDKMGVQSPTYNTRIVAGPGELEAESAFEAFKNATEATMRWFVVGPGSHLIFRNDLGLHSRKAIESGSVRRVHRTYWHNKIDVLRSAAKSDGHVFDIKTLTGTAA